jgi:cell wall-associated NlpC family hydrolase
MLQTNSRHGSTATAPPRITPSLARFADRTTMLWTGEDGGTRTASPVHCGQRVARGESAYAVAPALGANPTANSAGVPEGFAMHALPQRQRRTRLAMLAGAAAMSAALIGVPAEAAEASAPVAAVASTAAGTSVKSAAPLRRDRILALARKYSGRPYRWGACGPNAFDASGFTKFVFGKAGVKLPHGAGQGKKGRKVTRADARPGDLVIFRDASGRVLHTGVYAGGNKIYDAAPGRATGKHPIGSQHVEFRRVL